MNKKYLYFTVIALLAVFGVASVVVGYSGVAKYVIEGDMYVEEVAEGFMPVDAQLGAMASPIRDGIEYDGFGGAVEYWLTGNCVDATTTIFSVYNGYGNMVVDTVVVDVTGAATSTWTMDVGTSSKRWVSGDAAIDGVGLATSTTGIFANTEATVTNLYGFEDPGTNSQERFIWDSGEYINATVTVVTAYDGAFLDGGNSFDCNYQIHGFLR